MSVDNTITEIMIALPQSSELVSGTWSTVSILNTSLGIGGASGTLICRKYNSDRGEIIWRRTVEPATIYTWGWHEGVLSSCERVALVSDLDKSSVEFCTLVYAGNSSTNSSNIVYCDEETFTKYSGFLFEFYGDSNFGADCVYFPRSALSYSYMPYNFNHTFTDNSSTYTLQGYIKITNNAFNINFTTKSGWSLLQIRVLGFY